MKSFFRYLFGLVGLAMVLGGGYVFLAAIAYLIEILKQINPQIAAPIIATSGTIIVAVVSVLFTQKKIRERQIQEAHREKKVAVYDRFMDTMVEVMQRSRKSEDDPNVDVIPEDFETFFYEFNKSLIVWGSPEVIAAWHRFRDWSAEGSDNKNAKEMMLTVDNIFRAIRSDLGNKNWGLARGDLIRLFINDWNRQ